MVETSAAWEVHANSHFRNSNKLSPGGYYAGFPDQRHDSIRYVFRSLDLGEAATARTVHLLASYWGLVLMSFHAGMHGNRIMGVLRKITTTQQTSKIRIWSLRMIIVLLAIGGLYAFIKNKIGSYLFLRTQFVFVDFSQSVVWSIIDYLLVSILFIVLGYVCTYLICLKHIHKYNHFI